MRTHMGMVPEFNLFGHLNILDNCTIRRQIKAPEAEAVASSSSPGWSGRREDRFPAQLSAVSSAWLAARARP